MSKLIHLFTSLPTPSDIFIKKIEHELHQFLWDGKPDKIKRIQITQSYNKVGLQMIDIRNFIKSLKISWILVNNSYSPWIYHFTNSIASVDTLSQLGNLRIRNLAQNTRNKFWQSALYALHNFTEKVSQDEIHNVLNIPLWLNSNFKKFGLCGRTCLIRIFLNTLSSLHHTYSSIYRLVLDLTKPFSFSPCPV